MASLKTQAIHTALSGNWQKAIEINKVLIKQDPQDIDALNRLAFALSTMGKTKDARLTYKKVLKIDSLNPLALRNLKKLGDGKLSVSPIFTSQIKNTFIEEQGKTKVVELVNVAQPFVINNLRTGQLLELVVKRSKIFILTEEKKYIGVLPDNIGKRLIKFTKAGNKYEAYVKSSFEKHVIIFIKEVKRAAKLKDQPSFVSSLDKSLSFEKDFEKKFKDQDGSFEDE
ncbi:MAG: hypothetical protein A2629_03025 [Candidatus Levybacteria bacterium RIFCSPHIGHO2_01_FULL_41_15]|nr:MAG: hypothetical protein A2629_03025 [Candidatus Levybacteria bacterium RIFCSPHIGHO2_01_FULL_41_15]